MTDVLLVGGGHTHLAALALLAERARRTGRLRLRLVAPQPRWLYSGMMPGWVAGQYAERDCAIDLAALAASLDVEWVCERIVDIDFARRCAIGASGRRLSYDLLSINVGADTQLGDGRADAHCRVLGAKPVADFAAGWRHWQDRRARIGARARLVVAGGGAAGFELACALRAHVGPEASVTLLAPEAPLAGSGPLARRAAGASLARLRIDVITGWRYVGVDGCRLRLQPVRTGAPSEPPAVEFDLAVIATGAAPAAWLVHAARRGGLAVGPDGGLRVEATLRSVSDPAVFAGGDCASFASTVPRSGVHALRQGPVLAAALAAAAGLPPASAPRGYRPRLRTLALLNRCDGTALAVWGPLAASGGWAWRWKDRIDRRFMARFARPR